jgi:TonB-dependent starch-binding outer membrane protein SusC
MKILNKEMEKKSTFQGKLLKLMRFSIIQLGILVLTASIVLAHDSNAQDLLDRPLSIKLENEGLKNVLRTIEKVAEVSFSYKKGIINKEKKVTLDARNEKLSTILDRVFQNTNLEYEVMGQQIILTKVKTTSQVPPSVSEPKIGENTVRNSAPKSLAITITGKILSETKEPLVGATVAVKGTTNGTVTDENGQFSLSVPDKEAVLLVQFISYLSQEIKVGDQTDFIITLEPNDKTLGEVVVIGYGTTNRRDILGAVSSVKEKDIEQTTPVNAFDAIQGRLAGVQITSNGGPGSGSDIKIRGTSTFSGGVNPLYVVDGQQLDDIDNLNPNDIASIEVLKDGASAAIYGSKSANGVVIITTKSGSKSGDVKINVDYSRGMGNITSAIPTANTRQRNYYESARNGNNPDARPGDSLSLLYRNSPDVQGLIFRTSIRNQANVSLSGGSDKYTFYWNTGALDDQGAVVNSSYQRFNTSLKIDANLKKKISAGTKLNLSYEFQKGLNEGTVFQQLAERIAYFPIFEPNGTFTPEIAGRQNSVAEAFDTKRDNRNFRTQSFNFIQWNLLPSLSLKSTLGVNFRIQKENDFDPTTVQTIGRPATGEERNGLSHDIQHENYLTFKKKIGNHNVAAIAGMQIQRWNEEQSTLSATAFLSDNIQTFNNVSLLNLANTNTDRFRHSLTAYFGDASYNYKGKYLVKGTVRRDGSSRFGIDKRYGVFPSGSIGWRVSGEDFMNKYDKVVNNLMLRASYGATGNERIGNYESRLLYRPGFYYGGINGVSSFQLANPILGWESTLSKNVGIDLTTLRNRLDITVDFWDKTTKDLLYTVPLPEETGFSGARRNIGSVQNRGVDISLGGTPYKTKNFDWKTSFNVTFLKNKVLQLADKDGFQSGNFLIQEGQPLGNIFGYINNGIFKYDQSNAFDANGVQLTPVFDDAGKFKNYQLNGSDYAGTVNQIKLGSRVLLGGDIYWADLNKDFLIDGANDRTIIGNGLPKYFGGFFNDFRYKNVSLSFLIDYSFGNDIFQNYEQQRNDLNSANETPSPDRILKSWFKQGDVAEYASLDRARTQNQLGPNSKYVSSGDYIKWRNIRLNFNAPKSLYKHAKWISNVTFNLSFNNLLTFTNYQGYNPELGTRGNPLQPGQDNLRYPNKRDVLLGVKFQL